MEGNTPLEKVSAIAIHLYANGNDSVEKERSLTQKRKIRACN